LTITTRHHVHRSRSLCLVALLGFLAKVPAASAQALPDLTIAKSHTGNFTQEQSGTYTLTVSNIGASPTGSPVWVFDSLPSGLAATAAAGTGWSCNVGGQSVVCSRSDALAPAASYPPITLTVAVAPNAPASVTNTAVVGGGGDINVGNNATSDPRPSLRCRT